MKAVWQRWIPDSLFARLTVLLLVTLVITQLFAISLFRYNRDQLLARQVSEQIVDAMAELEMTMEGMDASDQQDFLEVFNRPYGINLHPASQLQPPADIDTDTRLTRQIVKRLQSDHIPFSQLGLQMHPRWRLWLHVNVLGKPYWLTLPLGRLQHENQTPMIWMGIGITIFALLAASWFAWRMNRPLRRLSDASQALARGEQPTPLEESGPRELRLLARQFNHMMQSLQAADQERRLMLAGISHDVRTPLTRLRLGIEMMQDDSLRDGMCTDVADIERIVQQFTAFIGGEPDEAWVDTDLALLLQALAQRFDRAGQPVTLHLDPLPRILVKPLAIERLLANLLDNARRYGAPSFDLSARPEGECIRIEVRDHGPGIADADIARLMTPFVRGNAARGGDGGSGLGLAIAERIVKAHGGRIALENAPGGGLQVNLLLPLRPPA
ncbi:ATP-binding protein [Leeia oryzae]|uniref:ATP-binding protein n=1 Tax=Leeia oryzae TaxID=356662 RepID=UPI000369F0D9|nr:ATP-binding protein [Leeia oryzae]